MLLDFTICTVSQLIASACLFIAKERRDNTANKNHQKVEFMQLNGLWMAEEHSKKY